MIVIQVCITAFKILINLGPARLLLADAEDALASSPFHAFLIFQDVCSAQALHLVSSVASFASNICRRIPDCSISKKPFTPPTWLIVQALWCSVALELVQFLHLH